MSPTTKQMSPSINKEYLQPERRHLQPQNKRFQPQHNYHYEIYLTSVKDFGATEVIIIIKRDVSNDKTNVSTKHKLAHYSLPVSNVHKNITITEHSATLQLVDRS